jgi:uncharacterized protein (DUF2147 family)
MKHHAFSAAMGLLLAVAVIAPSQSQAASADPTGIWRKADQGERPGKMQVFWCGRTKKLLCAKIVWLQNPNDSHGRPLHDVRNEDPSMHDRPIMGLPIFSGLTPTAPNTWSGKIYNPEDGNTYSATLTLVSRSQIHLKGCKAWLLCGERTWLRTTLPTPEPEIEASAEPEASPAPSAKAAAEASPAPSAKAAAEAQAEEPSPEESALANAEMLTPAAPPSQQDVTQGYRFLNVSADSKTSAGLSGENVPSMFVMTTPIASDADSTPSEVKSSGAPAETAAPREAAAPAAHSAPAVTQQAAVEPAPLPQPKPKAKPPIEADAAPTPKPQAAPSAPPTHAAVPAEAAGGTIEAADTDTAETASIEEQPLTRRQRRLLRRQQLQGQQQPFLPWLH